MDSTPQPPLLSPPHSRPGPSLSPSSLFSVFPLLSLSFQTELLQTPLEERHRMPLEEKGKGRSRAGSREWRPGSYTASPGGVLCPVVYVNGAPWGCAVHRLGSGLPRPWHIGNGAGLWRWDEANTGGSGKPSVEQNGGEWNPGLGQLLSRILGCDKDGAGKERGGRLQGS